MPQTGRTGPPPTAAAKSVLPCVASEDNGPRARPRHKAAAKAPISKDLKKELQKQQHIFQQLEEKISGLAKQKTELEASLTDSSIYSDKDKFIQTENGYKKVTDQLSQANKEYEIVFEKIMKLEESLTS